MKYLLPLVLLLSAAVAEAQTTLPCTSPCPERYYWESQPCTAGVCARTAEPVPSDFLPGAGGLPNGRGMGLGIPLSGIGIKICAPVGEEFLGTGTLRVYVWEPWLPDTVSATLELELDVADVFYASATCLHWADKPVGGWSTRRFLVSAQDVVVSGDGEMGVYITGLMGPR